LGRPRGSEAGFSYSTAMASDHSPWTYDKIFKFVKQPQSYVPGTKMTFAGLPSAKDRINLIAFLRTQEDTPMPIPPPAPAKPAGAPAAGGAAPAAGGGATGPAPAGGGAAAGGQMAAPAGGAKPGA